LGLLAKACHHPPGDLLFCLPQPLGVDQGLGQSADQGHVALLAWGIFCFFLLITTTIADRFFVPTPFKVGSGGSGGIVLILLPDSGCDPGFEFSGGSGSGPGSSWWLPSETP
jgi:hypothetical protein